MYFEMIYSKIHRATVSDSNLHYIGSITIDEKLLEISKLVVGQKVDIVNINNGERFTTYIIKGEKDSGDIIINGAASRKVEKGDKIIIIAYGLYDKSELEDYSPIIVHIGDNNRIISNSSELIGGEY